MQGTGVGEKQLGETESDDGYDESDDEENKNPDSYSTILSHLIRTLETPKVFSYTLFINIGT